MPMPWPWMARYIFAENHMMTANTSAGSAERISATITHGWRAVMRSMRPAISVKRPPSAVCAPS